MPSENSVGKSLKTYGPFKAVNLNKSCNHRAAQHSCQTVNGTNHCWFACQMDPTWHYLVSPFWAGEMKILQVLPCIYILSMSYCWWDIAENAVEAIAFLGVTSR